MELKYQKLFNPFKIGKTEIKNRIAMCPMLTAGYFDEYGVINDAAVALYEERAKGGVGLVFTFGVIPNSGLEKNAMATSPFTNPALFIAQMRKLADRMHLYGTKLFVQLWFGIGRALPPMASLDGNLIAPSNCHNRWDPSVECREIHGICPSGKQESGLSVSHDSERYPAENRSPEGRITLPWRKMQTSQHLHKYCRMV